MTTLTITVHSDQRNPNGQSQISIDVCGTIEFKKWTSCKKVFCVFQIFLTNETIQKKKFDDQNFFSMQKKVFFRFLDFFLYKSHIEKKLMTSRT